MKFDFFTCILAVLFFCQFAKAEDRLSKLDQGAVAQARELVQVLDLKTTVEETYRKALDNEVGHFKRLGLEGREIEEVKDIMLDFFKEVMPYTELEPEFIRFYATKFTTEELKEINTFVSTPTGKKAFNLSTTIMISGVKAGQQRVQERLFEVEKKIMPIVEKSLTEKKEK